MEEVYIRTDANEHIASGHLMRCLSIAGELSRQNVKVVFIFSDHAPEKIVQENGYESIVLDSKWDALEMELPVITKFIREHQVKNLLVDSYFATAKYLKNLSEITTVTYMDDMSAEIYPVQRLVHYSVFADEKEYKKCYEENGYFPECLVGKNYIPLREEFAYQPFFVQPTVRNVLITMGGTDLLGVMKGIFQETAKNSFWQKVHYHAILGAFCKEKDWFYHFVTTHDYITLHENVQNMSYWMRFCDAAISAAGTTLYELCACGTPTVCAVLAQNQLDGAVQFGKQGYMYYAGNAEESKKDCILGCMDGLKEYMDSYELRRKRSKKQQQLVDGKGAERIAKKIVENL